jgi:hypothetical protein
LLSQEFNVHKSPILAFNGAPERLLNRFLTSGSGENSAPCSFHENKPWFQVFGLARGPSRTPDSGTV